MLINAESLEAARKGFNLVYQQWYGTTETEWQRIATEATSTTSEEVYPWLGQSTKFREWIGPRVVQNLATHSFTIVNRDFENTVGVKRNHLEDDKLGIYKPMFGQLGQDAKQHPDELVFEIARQADQIACYDGQYLLDTDHPVLDEDGKPYSVANFFPGAGPLWMLLCTTKVVKPFIYQKRRDYAFVSRTRLDDPKVFDEKEFVFGSDGRGAAGVGLWQLVVGSREPMTRENYLKVRSCLQGFRGDNGRPLRIKGDLLLCANTQQGAAEDILLVEKLANGATNPLYKTASVLATPWLD